MARRKAKKTSANQIKFFDRANLLATFFGAGNFPIAPGTVASFVALPLWLLYGNALRHFDLSTMEFNLVWLGFILLMFVGGAQAAEEYAKKVKEHDSSKIVVDEIVGQLLVLLLSHQFIMGYIKIYGYNVVTVYGFYMFIAFILFRVFDIFKPSFIGSLDKKIKNGYGVMIDDIAAAFVAVLIIDLAILIAL